MSHECDVCGREFDSERGLHVHQGRKHEGKPKGQNQQSRQATIELTAKQFGAATFAFGILLGLTLGGLGGAAATGVLQDTPDLEPTPSPSEDNVDTEDTGNAGDGGDMGDPAGGQTETVEMSNIEMEGEPVLGDDDAPVTMVVYEDFECPFCKRFEEGAVPQIVSNYVDSGQVRIVWKDKPLTQLHPWAKPAAEAMECVYREGGNDVFWALKDKVFSDQNQLSAEDAQSQIKSWAAEEGVSESAVQSCIDRGDAMSEVEADSSEGEEVGASGTPTSFLNGQKLVGAQPYSQFETVIEEELTN
jgi:protein-disulfide isomerase